jgi:hypothetical protein
MWLCICHNLSPPTGTIHIFSISAFVFNLF